MKILQFFGSQSNSQTSLMHDIWYMLRDHEKYVYHYTTAHTLTQHILPGGAIRFSSFGRLNDPREYKQFDLDAHSLGPMPDDLFAMKNQMEHALKTGWNIACFVADPVEASMGQMGNPLSADRINAMHERGHSRPRMWAQYAGNHSGACLVFHKKMLDAVIQCYAKRKSLRVFRGAVTYQNVPGASSLGASPFVFSTDSVRRYGISKASELHIDQYFQELYLTKNKDWDAEREFRWLLRSAEADELFMPFGQALVGIALGEKFPEEMKPAIGRFAANNDVSICMMDWRRAFPQPKPLTLRMLLPPDDPLCPKEGW